MNAYYFVCFLTLLIQWILPGGTDKQYKWKLFWSFLPLFLFGALRVDFGNDYVAYETLFDLMHESNATLDSELHSELGYQLLCMVFPSFRSLLIFSSFLLCVSLGVFLYNYIPKKYLWFALLLMLLAPQNNVHGNLVGIRHGIMTSCFLLSFSFVQKRKLVPFAIVTFALSFIHTSALFFMPVAYFVGRNKPITKREIVIWSITLAAFLVLSMSSIYNIVSYYISSYFDRYEFYLADETNVRRGWLNISAMTIFIFVFLYTLYSKKERLSEMSNSILRMGLLYCGMAFIGSLSIRGSLVYNMFFIAAICDTMSHYKNDSLVRITAAVLSIAVSVYAMFYVWMGSPHWSHSYYHSLIGTW